MNLSSNVRFSADAQRQQAQAQIQIERTQVPLLSHSLAQVQGELDEANAQLVLLNQAWRDDANQRHEQLLEQQRHELVEKEIENTLAHSERSIKTAQSNYQEMVQKEKKD